jgi:hypothetical protein
LIGPAWLDATDEQGRRRLDDPNDWVRLEIAHALNRNITLIPVCVSGARLPTPAELPDDIRGLLDHSAVSLTQVSFRSEMSVLARDIRQTVGTITTGRDQPGGRSRAAKAGAELPMPPHQDVRVSMSALVRIAIGDKYVLIRNRHRPESFAPIGGVYKYFPDGRVQLDSIDFRPQELDEDMRNDVRGFLPYRCLNEFINWFDGGRGRENAQECILRELGEEFAEIGFETGLVKLPDVRLSFVRTVREGPEAIAGENYVQFRTFDVYEVVAESARDFLSNIQAHAAVERDLFWATSNEIIRGRHRSGHVIGAHSPYLFGQTRYRSQDPPF